ncbi:Gfo/Idh/MocA family oxidoreductase [Candidatus Kirkpatrickella diaphorinae]|uniref:Gfo/Idh/MocA family oxidoreductase n=1 Tax=Candidatus Kirkpatrickella diaphorinae TaxID=2984322 RepID=A0ABY6GKF1_9PROT|nr:Gfo/Idh/MocA family oxidoreductase [Candidatus Kirkpatrickella diaphorinae]UYH51807.1 Gfo/Idh/MocA family oxidoreductase [Candidatus Kirkpatrickella diaphorinae]
MTFRSGASAMRPLRVGLIGAGHFGRFHALKSRASNRETLEILYDPDPSRAQSVAREVGCDVAEDIPALLARVEAVIIAAPAEHHYALAATCLEARKHVLIEKPIAATREEGEKLGALAAAQNCVLQVGHLLRYSAEHEAISTRVTKPIYIEATRIAPFKDRGTDVSVILDLMIHDLDLVLSLVRSPIRDIDALGVAVSSAHEDIANARVRFENGCVATITASRISLKTERKMRIFGAEGYLSADFMKRELTFIGRERGLPLPGTGGFRREAILWADHDNIEAEHEAFVASCQDGAPVLVNAEAGIRALDAALQITACIEESRARVLASGLGQLP